VLAICAGVVPAAPVAADDGSAAPQPASSIRRGDEIKALLGQIEDQIVNGRTFVPANDSAAATWSRMMSNLSFSSPGVTSAFGGFITVLRKRAHDEEAAGHTVISVDLALFADQAAALLVRRGVASVDPTPAPIPPAAAPDGSPQRGGGTERTEPDRSSVPDVALLTTNVPRDPTTGSASADDTAAPVIETPPERRVESIPDIQRQLVAEPFTRRGDEMLAIKDISAARKFYEYAANAGSARAADALARTYDPSFAAQTGIPGVKSDRVMAAHWYEKAAALGLTDAAVRLRSVTAQVVR
jgi:hypothetical protein